MFFADVRVKNVKMYYRKTSSKNKFIQLLNTENKTHWGNIYTLQTGDVNYYINNGISHITLLYFITQSLS